MMPRDVEVIHDNPDAPAARAPAAELPMLNEAGQVIVQYALPADFPETATLMADGSVVVTFDWPVTLRFRNSSQEVREEKYGHLHLYRLTGKDQTEIRKAGQDDFRQQMIACSARITLGRARLLHDAMDGVDIAAVIRVISFFQTPGRKITPQS